MVASCTKKIHNRNPVSKVESDSLAAEEKHWPDSLLLDSVVVPDLNIDREKDDPKTYPEEEQPGFREPEEHYGREADEQVLSEEESEPPNVHPGEPDLNGDETIMPAEESGILEELDKYLVDLAVDKEFKLNEKGELRVWIGKERFRIFFEEDMVHDETFIPAEIGQYAKITPYAPDFEISPPAKECIKIHPSGSDVRFTLTPKKAGSFKVSADIELFNNEDCSGISVPKTAKTLTVHVIVDNNEVVKAKFGELIVIVWDQFKIFWKALIAFIFFILLYLIRRLIKKRVGYKDENAQKF